MAALSYKGAKSTGHGPYPPQSNTGPSASTVFVNGKPVHLIDDVYSAHSKPGSSPRTHTGATTGSSGTVFADGKEVVRIGDAINGNGCRSSVAEGSPDVLAGD